MNFIKKLTEYLFYNPAKVAKSLPNVTLASDTVLLKECRFSFESAAKDNQISIGANSMIGASFVFESSRGQISIGNNTFINGGTKLISRSSIVIGDYVTIAWGCIIYDHNSHALNFLERQKDIRDQIKDYRENRSIISSKNWDLVKSRPIVIHNNAWIGFDSVILSGVTIGEGAIVGARSVVREDVEPWTVVAGNPAVIVKRLK
ncbi:thiogalactoside acetyltransferase [Glaciecola punicea ACAM 611]|uniref:Thiogalactoside acetyltransferase n=1 Tax=Glaciecola punicea ACAM 611 TaxID=1121923 RepID=H5TF50_9ALTE|nr:acyltransferase [Glaciecola punicea]GAB56977.1 thiogalactoside acetyltransferase [Glaciecola punicea ACAM 611]